MYKLPITIGNKRDGSVFGTDARDLLLALHTACFATGCKGLFASINTIIWRDPEPFEQN
jgi:hypothetical protein